MRSEQVRGRLQALYQFDLSVASGLVPDEEFVASGFMPDGPKTSHTGCDATKNRSSAALGHLPSENLTSKVQRYCLAGCDEAGRGALAGPACVACVCLSAPLSVMPDGPKTSHTGCDATKNSLSIPLGHLPDVLLPLLGVDDSKRLSPKQREELFPKIMGTAYIGIGWAPPAEIDRIGIVPALQNATRRAYIALGVKADLILLDRGLTLVPGRGDAAIRRRGEMSPHNLFSASPRLPLSVSPFPHELAFTRGDSKSLHIAAASIIAKVSRDRLMVELDQRVPGYGLARNKGYGTQTHRAAIARLGPSPIHRRSFKVK